MKPEIQVNGTNTWEDQGQALDLAEILKNDERVQVAGVDSDGQLRGKVMSKEKFLSIVDYGFGMSSAIFGWDMHDMLFEDNEISSSEAGYADFTSVVDKLPLRRLPWANNMPFFFLRFTAKNRAVSACGRGMLKVITDKLANDGYKAVAGVELEFFNFQTPTEDGYQDDSSKRKNLAAFLRDHQPSALRPLTEGMFGYSVTRPMASSDFFFDVIDTSKRLDCDVESWHTESGPGVFEAALRVCDIQEMADRVSLFKYTTRCLGNIHGVTPCFLAKPIPGLPGSSGHIHVSLTDLKGSNLFARSKDDVSSKAPWSDLNDVSDLGRHFLAGLLNALPDLMPLLAPTINSYKRLVENFWAPVHLSWGLEDRRASIRLIAPPVCKPQATRFEIRIPGADLHPHYALAALVSAGWNGVEKEFELTIPPLSVQGSNKKPELLPNSLEKAVERFRAPKSVARELFGSEFVDFFAMTREHELRLYREAVTDWEFKRYIEIV